MDSFYKRADDHDVIIPSFTEVEIKFRMENVKSCVSIGTGHGGMELPCLEHSMPNLTQFTAVEPDPESAATLKKNLAERLPNVRSDVCQETVQSWRDPDEPVDAVLLFHVLYHLNPEERMALFKRLYDTVFKSGGFLIILIHSYFTSDKPSAYCRVLQLLKPSEKNYEIITDREVVDAVVSVGFELCYERMYNCHLNVKDPDDAFLSLFLLPEKDVGLEAVRHAAKEVFGDSERVNHDVWLAIFRKP